MKDYLTLIGGVIALLVAFGALVLLITVPLGMTDCTSLGQTTRHPTQYAFFGGGEDSCLINIDGQWIPTSNWRVIK